MILFLDYDGVLHPNNVFLYGRQPKLHGDGHLFMWAPLLVEILEPYESLRIVLSTSWVRALGFGRARDYLPAKLSGRVIGGTWHRAMGRHEGSSHRLNGNWYDAATRYEQIARYISRAEGRAENWLAIDDDTLGWSEEARNNLIETDGRLGLSRKETQSELQHKLAGSLQK